MTHLRRQKRHGSILVFAALLLIAMMAFLAFAVDIGYVLVARTELQRSADAASMAAAWQLIHEGGFDGTPDTRETAERYALLNKQGHQTLTLGEEDVVVGYLSSPSDPANQMTYNQPNMFNAVQILVRKADDLNGEVPFFFARALGYESSSVQGRATAAFLNNIHGFSSPEGPGDRDLQILPFALDEETWDDLAAGTVLDDDWEWDEDDDEVQAGHDFEYEINLFPQGTGSPGNRGTVDIGSSNNSTADLARQIVHGISPADLAHLGGTLELDENHERELNGDTGISAGVKDELASIIGQTRIIPIFSQVVGNGNNAQYTIVKWVGVRILEVKLTGPMKQKRVIVQPATVITRGAIPTAQGDPQTSTLVYSPPWIVR